MPKTGHCPKCQYFQNVCLGWRLVAPDLDASNLNRLGFGFQALGPAYSGDPSLKIPGCLNSRRSKPQSPNLEPQGAGAWVVAIGPPCFWAPNNQNLTISRFLTLETPNPKTRETEIGVGHGEIQVLGARSPKSPGNQDFADS